MDMLFDSDKFKCPWVMVLRGIQSADALFDEGEYAFLTDLMDHSVLGLYNPLGPQLTPEQMKRLEDIAVRIDAKPTWLFPKPIGPNI